MISAICLKRGTVIVPLEGKANMRKVAFEPPPKGGIRRVSESGHNALPLHYFDLAGGTASDGKF